MNFPCVFYCCWVECSVNANQVKLVMMFSKYSALSLIFCLLGEGALMLPDVSAVLGYRLQSLSQTLSCWGRGLWCIQPCLLCWGTVSSLSVKRSSGCCSEEILQMWLQTLSSWTLSRGDDSGWAWLTWSEDLNSWAEASPGKEEIPPVNNSIGCVCTHIKLHLLCTHHSCTMDFSSAWHKHTFCRFCSSGWTLTEPRVLKLLVITVISLFLLAGLSVFTSYVLKLLGYTFNICVLKNGCLYLGDGLLCTWKYTLVWNIPCLVPVWPLRLSTGSR